MKRAHAHSSPRRLYRFEVEVYVEETDDWRVAGQVLLYDNAPDDEVEHALMSLGVYTPRGDDFLSWETLTSEPSAVIHECGDKITVRMMAIT